MVSGTRRKGEEKKDPPTKASNNRWAVLAGDDDEDDDEDEGDQGKGAKGELSARYYCELKSTASQDILFTLHAPFVFSVNVFRVQPPLYEGRDVLRSLGSEVI